MDGFVSFYNVSFRIISDIHDELQVYYLGFKPPTDVITLCFLQSAEHYYATRVLAPTIIEEHAALSALQQDTAASEVSGMEYTSPMVTNTLVHYYDISESNINTEQVLTASIDEMAPKLQEETVTNCVQSIPIRQAQHAVLVLCFQIGVSAHKGSRRRSKLKSRTPRVYRQRPQLTNNVSYFNPW